jgi:DNA-binding beta-propeller fold protein YncE
MRRTRHTSRLNRPMRVPVSALVSLLAVALAVNADESPVWPAPPAEPRIAYVQSISQPEDLGIKKGLFRRFGEFFTGSENRQLVRPMSVVEDDGVVYVGDPGAKGVHRFDTRGRRHQLIQREDRLPLLSPVGMARGNNGTIFIADSVLGAVFTLKRNGKFAEPLQLEGIVKQPTGIAIDPKTGHLFITDTATHQVKVFSQKGKLLSSFGRRGDDKNEFNFPTMLWRTHSGALLVTDSLNFRIQTYSIKGELLSGFGQLGNATGYLSRPKGVASDSAGNIYVIDSLFHALQIFTPRGELLLSIGRQGSNAGEFWLPTGIYIGEDHKIYVADSHNRRIQVFRPVGGKAS